MTFPSAIWPFKSQPVSSYSGTAIHVRASESLGMTFYLKVIVCSSTTVSWGDGTTSNVQSSSTGTSVSHTYSAPGDYVINVSDTVTQLSIVGNGGETEYDPVVEYGGTIFITDWPAYSVQDSAPMIIDVPRIGSYLGSFRDRFAFGAANVCEYPSWRFRTGHVFGKYAFSGLRNMRRFSVDPVDLTVQEGCFSDNAKLEDFTGLEHLVTFPDRCFSGCSSLLPTKPPYSDWGGSSSGISFGNYCFDGCKAFTNLNVLNLGDGKRVSSVGEGCFANCTLLSDLFGFNYTKLDTIPSKCFMNCTSITTLGTLEPWDVNMRVPNRVELKHIADDAFLGCVNMKYISSYWGLGGLLTVGARNFKSSQVYAFQQYSMQHVTSYGDECFMDCRELWSLANISPDLQSLGNRCFAGCYKMTFDDSGDMTSLSGLSQLPALSGVSVGSGCFMNCKNLQDVSAFVNARNSIPESCFEGCSFLHNVSPSASAKSVSGSVRAFADCSNVYVRSGVTYFSGLVDLSSETWMQSPIADEIFSGCRFLHSTPVFGPLNTSFGDGCFDGCMNLHYFNVDSSFAYTEVTSFGRRCFANCHWPDGPSNKNPLKHASLDPQHYKCSYQSQSIPAAATCGGLSDDSGIRKMVDRPIMKKLQNGSLLNLKEVSATLSTLFSDAQKCLDPVKTRTNVSSAVSQMVILFGTQEKTLSLSTMSTYIGKYTYDVTNGQVPFATQGSNVLITLVASAFSSTSPSSSMAAAIMSTKSSSSSSSWTVDVPVQLMKFSGSPGLTARDLTSDLDQSALTNLTLTPGRRDVKVGEYEDTATGYSVEIYMDVSSLESSYDDSIGTHVLDSAELSFRLVATQENHSDITSDICSVTFSGFSRMTSLSAIDLFLRNVMMTYVRIIGSFEEVLSYPTHGDGYATLAELTSLLGSYMSSYPARSVDVMSKYGFVKVLQFPYGDQCFMNSESFVPSKYEYPFFRIPMECFKNTSASDLSNFRVMDYGEGCFAYSNVSTVPKLASVATRMFEGCTAITDLSNLSTDLKILGIGSFLGCSGITSATCVPNETTAQLLADSSLNEQHAACRLFTAHVSQALAGTSISSMNYTYQNTLPDPTIQAGHRPQFARDVFKRVFQIDVVNVHPYIRYPQGSSDPEQVTEPVIVIKAPGAPYIVFRVALPWRHATGTSNTYIYDGSYREGTKFDGSTEGRALSGFTLQLFTDSSCTVDDRSIDDSGTVHNFPLKFHNSSSRTGWKLHSGSNEYLILKVVSVESVADPVVSFTCGPYAFTGKFVITASGSNMDDFDVVGFEILSVDARAGYSTTSATIPVLPLAVKMQNEAYADCANLGDLSWISSQITRLPNGAFRGCLSLASLSDLPNTVTEFGNYAFAGCPFSEQPPVMPVMGTSVSFPAMTTKKTQEDLFAAKIKDSVYFDGTYVQNVDYGSRVRFRIKRSSSSPASEANIAAWALVDGLYIGSTYSYACGLHSVESGSQIQSLDVDGTVSDLVYFDMPSPDYGGSWTYVSPTGRPPRTFRSTFNSKKYNFKFSYSPDITSDRSARHAVSFDSVEFSTDDVYDVMKQYRNALSDVQVVRRGQTNVFDLVAPQILKDGAAFKFANVSYDPDTGEWNDIVAASGVGTVTGTSLTIGNAQVIDPGQGITKTGVRLSCVGHDGWNIDVMFVVPRGVLIRKRSVDIPAQITSIGTDCFSFKDYPDAENKLTCMRFPSKTSSAIKAMSGFPWGVPDGCKIVDNNNDVVYYKEPEDV